MIESTERSNKVVEYNGRTYGSLQEICDYLNIHIERVQSGLRSRLTLTDSISRAVRIERRLEKEERLRAKGEVYTYKSKMASSMEELCEMFDIRFSVVKEEMGDDTSKKSFLAALRNIDSNINKLAMPEQDKAVLRKMGILEEIVRDCEVFTINYRVYYRNLVLLSKVVKSMDISLSQMINIFRLDAGMMYRKLQFELPQDVLRRLIFRSGMNPKKDVTSVYENVAAYGIKREDFIHAVLRGDKTIGNVSIRDIYKTESVASESAKEATRKFLEDRAKAVKSGETFEVKKPVVVAETPKILSNYGTFKESISKPVEAEKKVSTTKKENGRTKAKEKQNIVEIGGSARYNEVSVPKQYDNTSIIDRSRKSEAILDPNITKAVGIPNIRKIVPMYITDETLKNIPCIERGRLNVMNNKKTRLEGSFNVGFNNLNKYGNMGYWVISLIHGAGDTYRFVVYDGINDEIRTFAPAYMSSLARTYPGLIRNVGDLETLDYVTKTRKLKKELTLIPLIEYRDGKYVDASSGYDPLTVVEVCGVEFTGFDKFGNACRFRNTLISELLRKRGLTNTKKGYFSECNIKQTGFICYTGYGDVNKC